MIDFVSIPELRMKKLRRSKGDIKKLKELTDVKINLGEDVSIECEDSIQLMRVKEVIKAFGRGFDFEDALYLLDDAYGLCVIDIKDFSGKSSNRMNELRGRVIGREGKSKNIIERLADAKISIYGKTVSIIGKWETIDIVRQAVSMLLDGRKHGNVYKFLEENIKKV